jgi:PAS domain S-box-containing protein
MSSQPLLAQTEQLFHHLFQQASLGVAVEDLEGKLLLANRALCSMLGYSESELLAMSCSQFANPEDSEDDWALFQQLRAGVIDKYSLEKLYVRKNGTRFWGRLNVSLLTGSGERSSQLVSAFVEDITERKRAEEDLRQRDIELAEVQRLAGFGIWQWDAKTDQVIWSKEIYLRTGYDPNLPAPRLAEHARLFTPESWDRLQQVVKEAVEAGTSYELDVELVVSKATTQWVTTRGEPVRNANGQIVGLRGTVQDITERKRAEVALRESEQRFRLAVQAGGMYAFEWDVVTDVIVRSIESLQILNWTNPERDTGREFHARIHPEDRALYAAMEARLTPENPGYQISFRTLRADGTAAWCEDTGRASFDARGKMVRVIGMVADITERKQAEQALRESEDRLRLLLDSTAEAIYGIDLEHRCTFCNPACLRTLGYERMDELLGKNMHDLIHHKHPDGRSFPAEECRVHQVIRTGEGVHAEDEVLWRANGTSFPAEYWSHPQHRGDELVGAVVAFIDITERKLAEATLANVSRKLIEAQEQERTRIGRELHDDIGQRLALLAVELRRLQDDSATLPGVRRRLVKLQKQTSAIAVDIQSLSHELHSAKLQYLGIASAMRGFCREFGEQQRVEIEFSAQGLPAPLSADVSLCLFRVLQEALHNSAKHSGARHFEARLWGATDEIHLTVKDSGTGFDLDRAKMSRGLGLISMDERLKLVNGTLSIESQSNRGTTIHARVPLGSASESIRAAG